MIINSVEEKWKEALKAKNASDRQLYSMVRAEYQTEAIKQPKENRVLSEHATVDLIRRMIKQRKEIITTLEAANRPEQIEIERHDIELLQGLLPSQLEGAELRDALLAAVGVEVLSGGDFRAAMATAMQHMKASADGRKIKDMVEALIEEFKTQTQTQKESE